MSKAMAGLFGTAGALVMPLALLLFLQWPLREGLQAYSREANDVAQVIFAWYVAAGVTAATARGEHLVARAPARARRWRSLATMLCVGPWAAFMVWSCFPAVVQSVANAERFAETLNPGYFAIRLAMVFMLVLVLAGLLLPQPGAPVSGASEGR